MFLSEPKHFDIWSTLPNNNYILDHLFGKLRVKTFSVILSLYELLNRVGLGSSQYTYFEVSETVIDNFCASSIVIGCYVLFPIMMWTNFLWRETHVWARGTSCIIWKSCRLKNAHLWIIVLRSLWFESCSKLYDKWWAGCGTIWNNFINKFSPEKPLALITMLQVVKNSEFTCFSSSRKLLAKVRKLLWSPWSIEKRPTTLSKCVPSFFALFEALIIQINLLTKL